MADFSHILATRPDFDDDDREWLHHLVADWQVIADLSFADLLLLVQNGDGKYDIKYRAKENGTGEVVDYTYLYYIVGGAVAFILFAVVVIAVKRSAKTRKS